MKKTDVLEANVKAAFENADESQKKLLQHLWPDLFATDPYLKACEVLGITPKPPLADRSNKDEVSIDAYGRLIVCIRAKNMIDGKEWEVNYDGSQYHYTPLFKKNSAGFGLAGTTYVGWLTDTGVGSRLEYRTYDLMIEGVKEFDQYYQDFFNY